MNGKTINKEECIAETERIYHPFGPLYNEQSRVLILGSFPSVKSREQEFFYGHPQNRFWKVIAALFPKNIGQIEESYNTEEFASEEITHAETGICRDSLTGVNGLNDAARIQVPRTIEEKKALILNNGLALWDSIGSCEITGSSDASIRNAEPNDISIITDSCDIRAIYCNGKKSLEIYNRFIFPVLGRKAEALPSTSPANAAWSLEDLIRAWSIILDQTDGNLK